MNFSQPRAPHSPKNNPNVVNDKIESPYNQEHEVIAILDAGSQFGKVIDRRIRECNIKSVMIPFNTPAEELKKYRALIISGGPASVYAHDAPKYDKQLFHLNIPILGICYGLQMMAHTFNGKIEHGIEREDGQYDLNIINDSLLFDNLPKKIPVLLTHGDVVSDPGPLFNIVAKSANGIISAIESTKLNLYGVQFHPEVDLTPDGPQIFRNFLYKIVGLKGHYTIDNRKDLAVEYIRERVGKKKVLSLVSGGVDSSVCTALLNAALEPDQIYALHVDTGFMRHQESEQVGKALAKIGINVCVIDASKEFLNGTTYIDDKITQKLCEVTHPEIKRKIIGDVFMKLCDEAVKEKFNLKFEDMILAQGTLRPDLIESASIIANQGKTADTIKTHHNDTQLVRRLRENKRVVEPLTDYHKDEVRILGKELGLPEHLIWRQPFPGPGLAIRILCADKPYFTEYDNDILKNLKQYENDDISVCLLSIRTVGVQGDGRTYSHCVALTNKNKNNNKQLLWKSLYDIAKKIPRQTHHVNRCIYLFGDELNGHQKDITPTYLNFDVIQQLRECDRIVNEALNEYGLIQKTSQVPVVLFPSNFGHNGKRSICIRPFITNDFMTGIPGIIGEHIPEKMVYEIVDKILKVPGIIRVGFDLTPKPPGTTEWE